MLIVGGGSGTREPMEVVDGMAVPIGEGQLVLVVFNAALSPSAGWAFTPVFAMPGIEAKESWADQITVAAPHVKPHRRYAPMLTRSTQVACAPLKPKVIAVLTVPFTARSV